MNEISLPNFNLINFKKIARFKMSDNRDPEGVPVKLKKNLEMKTKSMFRLKRLYTAAQLL